MEITQEFKEKLIEECRKADGNTPYFCPSEYFMKLNEKLSLSDETAISEAVKKIFARIYKEIEADLRKNITNRNTIPGYYYFPLAQEERNFYNYFMVVAKELFPLVEYDYPNFVIWWDKPKAEAYKKQKKEQDIDSCSDSIEYYQARLNEITGKLLYKIPFVNTFFFEKRVKAIENKLYKLNEKLARLNKQE